MRIQTKQSEIINFVLSDYNQEEIEMMFKLTPSPWLQMFIAHGIYKRVCFNIGTEITETSFSLKQIVSICYQNRKIAATTWEASMERALQVNNSS